MTFVWGSSKTESGWWTHMGESLRELNKEVVKVIWEQAQGLALLYPHTS